MTGQQKPRVVIVGGGFAEVTMIAYALPSAK
jgi:NADH dehydrogenase FAD-containing subunit